MSIKILAPDRRHKLRLGIDASNLRSGGAVTHLIEVCAALEEEADQIGSLILWGHQETVIQVKKVTRSIRLVSHALLNGSLASRLLWQRYHLSRLAQNSCDLLFIPGGIFPGSFSPFVTMCRNMLPFDPSEMRRYRRTSIGLRLRLLRWTQQHTFKRAAGVIFLTEYARNRVLNTLGPSSSLTTVIPHGVAERFRRPPRAVRHFTRSSPCRILYVSIIDFYKHQIQVAKAVVELRRKGLPVELTLVGPAYLPSLSRLQAVFREADPKGEYLHYNGPVSHEGLPSVYHRADIFVFGSSCENLPNVLLEAMASGLPIACSNRPPMPQILREAGVYFDPEQSDRIRSCLERLISSPALMEELGRSAYEEALRYSWSTCARTTVEFLHEAHERHRKQSCVV